MSDTTDPKTLTESIVKQPERSSAENSIRESIEQMSKTFADIDHAILPLGSMEAAKLAETLKHLTPIQEELKRAMQSASITAASFGESYVREAERAANSLHSSIAEEMQRAAESVRKASLGLDYSLGRLPEINSQRFSNVRPQDYIRPSPSATQLTETNSRLGELIDTMAVLVDVAKHQAELTQAINESTQTTLKYSIQTGEETRASTELARTNTTLARTSTSLTRRNNYIAVAALVVAVISLVISLYDRRSTNVASEARGQQERALRQKEIQVLNDISKRLAADVKTRSEPSPPTPRKQTAFSQGR